MERLNVLSRSPLLSGGASLAQLAPRTTDFHAVLMMALREGAALAPGSSVVIDALPRFNRDRRVAAVAPLGFSRL